MLDVVTISRYNIVNMFEWDEAKRRANLDKHGIDFKDAKLIFDGDIVVMEDRRCDYNEPRFVALGLLYGRVIVVIYIERGEIVRLISARKASRNEEITYFKRLFN